MSHELRTPLNAVLNLAALGGRACEPERLRDYLIQIERAGRSLLEVVNEILDFARLEGGAESLCAVPFEMGELLDRVLAIAAPLTAEKGLTLESSLDSALAGPWSGDVHKIERILVNLIGNAVKFTDQGGVQLRIAQASAAEETPRVSLTVQDTGIGIAPEQLPTLFAPFHQGDNSLARRHGGTGLGLDHRQAPGRADGRRGRGREPPGEGCAVLRHPPAASGCPRATVTPVGAAGRWWQGETAAASRRCRARRRSCRSAGRRGQPAQSTGRGRVHSPDSACRRNWSRDGETALDPAESVANRLQPGVDGHPDAGYGRL